MTTIQQIEIAQAILAGGLVKKVFHSVQLLRDENNNITYPAYPKGAEFVYSGIDDTHGLFAYIRTNGDYTGVPFKITSCARSYTMTAPMRIVFFNDGEDRDHEELIRQISVFTFMQNVNLVRIVKDKYRLVKEESPLFRASIDAKTFYVAIDVNVTFILLPSDCADSKCIVYPNPLLPCLAAASTSISSATS